MRDGRDERFDDELFIGQTEMGHIGPKMERPIFLVLVLPKRHHHEPETDWQVKHCIDSGDPNFRANDADLLYDGEYLDSKDGYLCILQVSINLLSWMQDAALPSCYWSIRLMYVSTHDALTNLGPHLSHERQRVKACIDQWAIRYLGNNPTFGLADGIPDGDGATQQQQQ